MAEVTMLTREAILAAQDIVEETFEVAEWGGSLKIRGLSKARQAEMRRAATVNDEVDEERLEVLMFIHGVVEPVFTTEDYEALRGKAAGAMDRVLKRILRASAIGSEAVKKAEASFPS